MICGILIPQTLLAPEFCETSGIDISALAVWLNVMVSASVVTGDDRPFAGSDRSWSFMPSQTCRVFAGIHLNSTAEMFGNLGPLKADTPCAIIASSIARGSVRQDPHGSVLCRVGGNEGKGADARLIILYGPSEEALGDTLTRGRMPCISRGFLPERQSGPRF